MHFPVVDKDKLCDILSLKMMNTFWTIYQITLYANGDEKL